MNRAISQRAIRCTAVLALLNTCLLRTQNPAEQDVWASVILSGVVLSGLAALFARMQARFPGKNLFEMLRAARSRLTADILTLLWLILGLGCAVRTVQSWGEFIQSCVLTETPHYVMAAALLVCCLLFLTRGTHILGQWSMFIAGFAAVLGLVLLGMSIQHYDWEHLLPGLRSAENLGRGTLSLTAFPGGELIFLTALFSGSEAGLSDDRTRARLWQSIVWTTAGIQLILFTVNVLVLSAPLAATMRFPGYFMTSIIGAGDFFRHVEVLSTFIAQITVTANAAVILLFLCQGTAGLWRLGDARTMAFPVVLVVYGLVCCLDFADAPAISQAAGGLRLVCAAAAVPTAAIILCPSRKIRVKTQ